jgi:DNA-binding CsgD family transcriptional regulator
MPSTVQNLIIVIALLTVSTVLVLGLWNMMKGGSPNRSQSLMRLRVLLQAAAIAIVMITIWILGH